MATANATKWEYFGAPERGPVLAYVTGTAPLSASCGLDTGRSADRLRRLLGCFRDRDEDLVEMTIATEAAPEKLPVPLTALGVFADVLDDMAEGRAVTVVPFDTAVGAEEAARQLGVSWA